MSVPSFKNIRRLMLVFLGRSAPSIFSRVGPSPPAINSDFPDPAIIQDFDSTWYSFATQSGPVKAQVARARSPDGPWEKLDGVDLLPDTGRFFTERNNWAPDVRVVGRNNYLMYFSGEVAGNTSHHCVGVARSDKILGPYIPSDEPFVCDLSDGGQIDASAFSDVDGRNYVTYKTDSNSLGPGGECGNGIEPRVPTPIMLQEVAPDGITKLGPPRPILDRVGTEPLVEAPFIYRHSDGTYILFFSAGCFTEPDYNVHYATSRSVRGPYVRAPAPLIVTNDALGLVAPGGASAVVGGQTIVFHANCEGTSDQQRNLRRCMHVRQFDVSNGRVSLR
ncbi:hypothetical protein HIM_07210 [Hirsutella minnesotensis 3608]|uniref:Uncharacterized protein n=1 Tax=Hirsutella minnesotensis 3608 TaxID=1043627 RepID=A0A0F7ZI47_9HYPO|nr:hypothetical protein HIM_07210 [Hirsutella minnesotensis 3608]